MQKDHYCKAQNRRILALARLTRRRTLHVPVEQRAFRDVDNAEISSLFDTISQKLEQSPILA